VVSVWQRARCFQGDPTRIHENRILACTFFAKLCQNCVCSWVSMCVFRATAHIVKVITVHGGSVGCLQPHLLLSDSSKPAPDFTVLSVKCNWSSIQSKTSLIQSKKSCLRRNFLIKNLETVCLRLSVLLSKIGTRTGASLSSIRKDRN